MKSKTHKLTKSCFSNEQLNPQDMIKSAAGAATLPWIYAVAHGQRLGMQMAGTAIGSLANAGRLR